MKESYFQKLVIKELSSKGAVVINNVANTKVGISDLSVCYKGKFIAIELKVGSYKPTALQEWFICSVRHAGGVAFVFRHSPDWKERLWEILNLTK